MHCLSDFSFYNRVEKLAFYTFVTVFPPHLWFSVTLESRSRCMKVKIQSRAAFSELCFLSYIYEAYLWNKSQT